jgi:hypothetical protein
MSVTAVARFERFFRAAASLDVDKRDIRRHGDFIDQKLYDLLIMGQATAKANGRDIIEPRDLPMTKGLQERIHEFVDLDEEIEVRPIMAELAAWPPLEAALSDETERRLPDIVGGLSLALARAFKIIDPDLRNPQTAHWERAFQVFDLLL